MFRHVPNALTASRLVLAAVFFTILSFYQHEGRGDPTMLNIAFLIYLVALFTDFLDGYLARRWKVTSKLGSFLDTTADKLLVTVVLMALVAVGRASPWLAAAIVAREIAILGLRGVAAADGTVFAPSPGGKAKATAQFVAILLAILRPGDKIGAAYLDQWAMLVAAVLTIATGIDYFLRYSAALRRAG